MFCTCSLLDLSLLFLYGSFRFFLGFSNLSLFCLFGLSDLSLFLLALFFFRFFNQADSLCLFSLSAFVDVFDIDLSDQIGRILELFEILTAADRAAKCEGTLLVVFVGGRVRHSKRAVDTAAVSDLVV